jgi:hypothetical protein
MDKQPHGDGGGMPPACDQAVEQGLPSCLPRPDERVEDRSSSRIRVFLLLRPRISPFVLVVCRTIYAQLQNNECIYT